LALRIDCFLVQQPHAYELIFLTILSHAVQSRGYGYGSYGEVVRKCLSVLLRRDMLKALLYFHIISIIYIIMRLQYVCMRLFRFSTWQH
jgi:hypothetical protein